MHNTPSNKYFSGQINFRKRLFYIDGVIMLHRNKSSLKRKQTHPKQTGSALNKCTKIAEMLLYLHNHMHRMLLPNGNGMKRGYNCSSIVCLIGCILLRLLCEIAYINYRYNGNINIKNETVQMLNYCCC